MKIFTHFETWPDWKSGHFSARRDSEIVKECRRILADTRVFGIASKELVYNPEFKSLLLDRWSVPLGHARSSVGRLTCFKLTGATIYEVNMAWALLEPEQRTRANNVADFAQAILLTRHDRQIQDERKRLSAFSSPNSEAKSLHSICENFIAVWKHRCYSEIPEKVPEPFKDMLPSYQNIALAILTSDTKYLNSV